MYSIVFFDTLGYEHTRQEWTRSAKFTQNPFRLYT